MPIYEYACGACGHHFEEWQKMSDKPVRTCPKCKAKKVEKLISQTSFTLKGGGWYSDLYAGPKPGAASKGDSSGSSSSESGESGGSKESSSKESSSKESSSKDSSSKDSKTTTTKADSGTKASGDKASGKKKTGAA
jgi:putative FmdB family regulatory protein